MNLNRAQRLAMIGAVLTIVGGLVGIFANVGMWMAWNSCERNVNLVASAIEQSINATGGFPEAPMNLTRFINTPDHRLRNIYTGAHEDVAVMNSWFEDRSDWQRQGRTCYVILTLTSASGNRIVPITGLGAIVWVWGPNGQHLHQRLVSPRINPPLKEFYKDR